MRKRLFRWIKWKERHLDFYALERVGVTYGVISTDFYLDTSEVYSIMGLEVVRVATVGSE